MGAKQDIHDEAVAALVCAPLWSAQSVEEITMARTPGSPGTSVCCDTESMKEIVSAYVRARIKSMSSKATMKRWLAAFPIFHLNTRTAALQAQTVHTYHPGDGATNREAELLIGR